MGGFIEPGAKISGGVGNPGIAIIDSPTGGLYESPNQGIGFALTAEQYMLLEATRFLLGYKPTPPFGISGINGSPFASGANPIFAISSPDSKFVYQLCSGDNTIHAYSVNPTTGVLSASAGSPFAVDIGISSMAMSPLGGCIAAVSTSNTFHLYQRSASTGALTSSYGPLNTVFNALSVCFSKLGFVYYGIAANQINYGSFTEAGAYVAKGSINTTHTPGNMCMSPDGRFLYVGATDQGDFTAYTIDPLTGNLTIVTGYPKVLTSAAHSICVSPDGSVVAITTGADLHLFVMNTTTGSALQIPNSPFVLAGVSSASFSADSQHLFTVNETGAAIHAYALNVTLGTLSEVAGSPEATGGLPFCVITTPNGNFVYTSNVTGNNVSGFFSTNAPTYNIIDVEFDPAGGLAGTVNINAVLTLLGQTILSQNSADTRYAQLAGLITQPFSAQTLTLDHAAGGLEGTPTNDNAIAGVVGEFITQQVASGAAVNLTTNVTANIASIALTAGDWDVEGVVAYHSSGTTNVNDCQEGISTVNATLPVAPGAIHCDYLTIVVPAAPDAAYQAPKTRISLAAPATVYLVALAHFTISTLAAYGQISARRVR